MDEKIDVTDLVEDLPLSRVLVAFERACREFGHGPTPEEAASDEFVDLFERELIEMAAADIIADLIDEGRVEAELAEDGSLIYYAIEE